MRRSLVDGVRSMSHDTRALFTGLVIGDDREQSKAMINDFRASGLSHVCAVSGQNVAYLLAMLAPFLSRLGRGSRWWVTLCVIAWFAVLTRGEPSVLRAAVMAGLVATNAALGSSMNARSILACTVMALLMIDPMLAWSVGFALSVGATAGLAWVSAGLSKVVGGRGVLAATLAAQAGTTPIQMLVFGSVPVVSVIANPLAVGVSGAVMMFGLPLALFASMVPSLEPALSFIMSIPVAWVAWVARSCASVAPTGALNAVLWVCVPVVIWWVHKRRAQRHRGVAG
jgi:competence protein ComEC